MIKEKNIHLKKLNNKKFSLVLSGGSAYGFAHLGVLKYLEENELIPNEIVGTSMGALIGGFYSIGYKTEKIIKILESLNLIDFLRLGISYAGFNKTGIYKLLKKYFKDIKINEVKIPVKIVTTSFESGFSKCFDKNDDVLLVDAIIASISIPGLFMPKKINEELFIDGFVSSNLPVEYANKKNQILAINVDNLKNLRNIESPKKIFRKLKRSLYVLTNTYYLMINNQTQTKLKDLEKTIDIILIEPFVKGFRKSDFRNWKKIAEKGYDETKKIATQ